MNKYIVLSPGDLDKLVEKKILSRVPDDTVYNPKKTIAVLEINEAYVTSITAAVPSVKVLGQAECQAFVKGEDFSGILPQERVKKEKVKKEKDSEDANGNG